ncbi:hypothetical protein H107_00633 [Trichophyton rubrum CBS 202.88]|nr:hypothetical protein H107_00633 [Trichophyton rubrum CBS 202.88]
MGGLGGGGCGIGGGSGSRGGDGDVGGGSCGGGGGGGEKRGEVLRRRLIKRYCQRVTTYRISAPARPYGPKQHPNSAIIAPSTAAAPTGSITRRKKGGCHVAAAVVKNCRPHAGA